MSDQQTEKVSSTMAIVEMIKANRDVITEQDMNEIFAAIKHYKDQYGNLKSTLGNNAAVMSFFSAMEESMKIMPSPYPVSCKKGCAHCCHINLDITEMEAEFIIDYCEEQNIKIDLTVLNAQKDTDRDSRAKIAQSACVFLAEDNSCRIYPVRPAQCRKYLVMSDPDECNFKKHPNGIVSVLYMHNVELIASGMINAGKSGNMAALLLNRLNEI